MLNATWSKAITRCADPERARHFLDLLAGTSAGKELKAFPCKRAEVLAAVFSGSQALGASLVSHPEWLTVLDPETLRFPRRKQGLTAEVEDTLNAPLKQQDFATALQRLRLFKQKEMLRIAARDLGRLG